MKTTTHTSQLHVRHGSNIVARIRFGKFVLFEWLHSTNYGGAHENDDSHIATPCSTCFEHSCTHTFWKVRTFPCGYISCNHTGAHENDESHIPPPCSPWLEHSCTHTFRQSSYFFMWLHSLDHDGAHENDDAPISTPCSPWIEHSFTHPF